MKKIVYFSSMVLFSSLTFATVAPISADSSKAHFDASIRSTAFANASFGTSDLEEFYTVMPPLYPDVVDLSLQRNKGFSEGQMVLNPKGIGIGESGSYWINYSATLFFDNSLEEKTVPVFLITNGDFDASGGQPMLGSTETVLPGVVTNIQGSGILPDIDAGTTLSLVASNGGGVPFDDDITVISWSITIHKISDTESYLNRNLDARNRASLNRK